MNGEGKRCKVERVIAPRRKPVPGAPVQHPKAIQLRDVSIQFGDEREQSLSRARGVVLS